MAKSVWCIQKVVTEIMINDKVDEVIEELFQSLLSRYHIVLKTSMKGIDFGIDCVHLLYYKGHKINSNRRGSYKDSPDWMENKKATKKPNNIKTSQKYQKLSYFYN